jgi:hypothetical protein
MNRRKQWTTLALCLALVGPVLAQDGGSRRFDFESDKPGEPPQGFSFGRTGKGPPGKWVVQAVEDAPSGKNVLAQTDADRTDYRFPVAYTGPDLKDLRLGVRCKPVSGRAIRAVGWSSG